MAKLLQKELNQFLQYLEIEKNRALSTIKNYDFYLCRFLKWAQSEKVKNSQDITDKVVTNYRLWLNRQETRDLEKLSKNTQNYHLIALRSFLKYLAKKDIPSLAPEKVELGKMPTRQVAFLEKKDLERLLEAPTKIIQNELLEKRDLAILETLFSTGLRVSELSRLTKEQINLKRREFPVRGKGSKLRIVFLSDRAVDSLKAYLKIRMDMSPFIFVSHDKARKTREKDPTHSENLTPRSIQRIVEKYKKIAGIPQKVSPHTLRHSYATDLLINGADIRSVQEMLGHDSITTTQIYTHITNKQLRKTHNEFHDKNT